MKAFPTFLTIPLILLSVLPLPALAERPAPSDELIQLLNEKFNDARFSDAIWGAKIKSLETGKVWYERNADQLLTPASNEKIPTSAATLEILGPDYTFKTTFTAFGEVKEGILHGELVAWGNGDPTLYTRFMKSPTELFETVAEVLKQKGISTITGNIVGDDNAFDDVHIGEGWKPGYLDAWYAAEFGPLQLNENYVDIQITPPTTAEGSVSIEPNLPSNYYEIINKIEVVTSGDSSMYASRENGTRTIVLSGKAVVGKSGVERSPTVPNPTLWYTTVLKETLEKNGITVQGEAVDIDDASGALLAALQTQPSALVLEHRSAPLSEILTGLMKRSQNMYAETMPRLVAWEETGKGTFDAGKELIAIELERMGVEKGANHYVDGSGLSNLNKISPNHIISILEYMSKTSTHGELWKSMQPIAGVDGTLSRRMKGTPAEGNVRAKTGTISGVRALSGYVTTADGEELVFSFIVNNSTASNRATEEVTDGALALIADYDRTTAATQPAGQ